MSQDYPTRTTSWKRKSYKVKKKNDQNSKSSDFQHFDTQKKTKPKTPIYSYALYLLGRQEYSVYDLRRKMVEKEYETDEIDRCLEELQKKNYQSDERCAKSLFYQGQIKNNGPQKIKLTMRQKGISADLIESIFEEEDERRDPEQQQQKLVDMIQRKYGAGPFDRAQQQKVIHFLLRKGFSQKDAWDALKQHRLLDTELE